MSSLFKTRKTHNLSRTMIIKNRYGIHARPAALIVKTLSAFDSDVWLVKDGNKISAKSLMGLLSLEASKGTDIKVVAEGHDAKEALDALQSLIDGNFDED